MSKKKKLAIIVPIPILVIAFVAFPLGFSTSNLQFSAHALPAKPGEDIIINIKVVNQGSTVWNISAETEFDDIPTSSNSLFILGEGDSALLKITHPAPDIDDGVYQTKVRLKYSSGFVNRETSSKIVDYTILPNVEITDLGWGRQLELPRGFGDVGRGAVNLIMGKNSLCITDSTVLAFKVHNKSANVYYNNLSASITLSNPHYSISIAPTTLELESIVPDGSNEYSLEISTNNSPPSSNELIISVFSEVSRGTPSAQTKTSFSINSC